MDTSPLLHFEAFIASLLVLVVITGVKMYTTTYVPRTDMRVIARHKRFPSRFYIKNTIYCLIKNTLMNTLTGIHRGGTRGTEGIIYHDI